MLHAGAFQLAEVDLAALLPEEALAPFAEELQGRGRRRERRMQVCACATSSQPTHRLQHSMLGCSRGPYIHDSTDISWVETLLDALHRI